MPVFLLARLLRLRFRLHQVLARRPHHLLQPHQVPAPARQHQYRRALHNHHPHQLALRLRLRLRLPNPHLRANPHPPPNHHPLQFLHPPPNHLVQVCRQAPRLRLHYPLQAVRAPAPALQEAYPQARRSLLQPANRHLPQSHQVQVCRHPPPRVRRRQPLHPLAIVRVPRNHQAPHSLLRPAVAHPHLLLPQHQRLHPPRHHRRRVLLLRPAFLPQRRLAQVQVSAPVHLLHHQSRPHRVLALRPHHLRLQVHPPPDRHQRAPAHHHLFHHQPAPARQPANHHQLHNLHPPL